MTDEHALAQFEALVQAQRPASVPWQPVTDYAYDARKVVEGIHPQLIWQHLIPCDDADVLDYGCGPEGHLVRLLREYLQAHQPQSQVSVEGYDPQYGDRVQLFQPQSGPTHDLVICREVLEHCTIRTVAQVVRRLCELSSQLVYVTTRFAQDPAHLLSVDTSDTLDPTHITMLTQPMLRLLFVLEGFRRRVDLEAKMDWKHVGRVLVYERA